MLFELVCQTLKNLMMLSFQFNCTSPDTIKYPNFAVLRFFPRCYSAKPLILQNQMIPTNITESHSSDESSYKCHL